jgi:hypothetical protein
MPLRGVTLPRFSAAGRAGPFVRGLTPHWGSRMHPVTTVLRLVHIGSGVYWAGSIFFFVTFLEPSLRSLGPDGGKVMIRLFERGFLKLIPIVAILTVLSGLWLLWILSSGFKAEYMGSSVGRSLSSGGALAIIALLVGLTVMRPAASGIWAIAKRMPTETDEAVKKGLMAEMDRLRARNLVAARVVFALLIGAVAMMAVARYV